MVNLEISFRFLIVTFQTFVHCTATDPCTFECSFYKSKLKYEPRAEAIICEIKYSAMVKDRNSYLTNVTKYAFASLQITDYSQVQAITVFSGTLNFIPSGIDKFFTNISEFQVEMSFLQDVTQENLKMFPKLAYLSLAKNFIGSIEENLFSFNPHLQHVDLSMNPLKEINANVFDKLHKLTFLNISVRLRAKFFGTRHEEVLVAIDGMKAYLKKLATVEDDDLEAVKVRKGRSKYFWVMIGSSSAIVTVTLGYAIYSVFFARDHD